MVNAVLELVREDEAKKSGSLKACPNHTLVYNTIQQQTNVFVFSL